MHLRNVEYVEVERAFIDRNTLVTFLIIPKFLSKAALISITDDLVQKINNLLIIYLPLPYWKGSNKIIRCALINDI